MRKTLSLVTACAMLALAFAVPTLLTHAAHPQAAVNMNCSLRVPMDPLTATGLATPWQLHAGCNEANPNQAVFVQAAIFSPAAGTLSIYPPLVINAGTTPAVAPVAPILPADAVVGIWGGGNDNVTTLVGAGAAQCVNGIGTPFGQVFFCGAQKFFASVNAADNITPPALGMGLDGKPCPSVRDFSIVDQDQSDNVTTTYLVTGAGTTAQNTAANRLALGGATVQVNPSDNLVLSGFIDPALGCTPFLAPDLADAGNMVPSQALDELQAAAQQLAPIALVPAGDPMVLNNGKKSLHKLNAYRVNVDQPAVDGLGMANTKKYCNNIVNVAPAKLALDKNFFMVAPSPVPEVGANLFAFLAARLQTTLGPNGLNCTKLLHINNPIHLTLQNGVAVDATITLSPHRHS